MCMEPVVEPPQGELQRGVVFLQYLTALVICMIKCMRALSSVRWPVKREAFSV